MSHDATPDATPRTDATRDATREAISPLAAARARIAELEDEVARLKRALAERARQIVPAREMIDAVGISPGGVGKVSGVKANGHPQFCQGVCCRFGA